MTRLPGWAKAALATILVGGTLLRFAGLSHDLAEGYNYHPDTPKQIHAVERFLKGTYYFHLGHSDYDGYPYFTSHLMEWIFRVSVPAIQGARQLVGLPVVEGWPETTSIYWLMRVLNASLASLLIFLLFVAVRREWGVPAGLLAALLLACSPADVAACHYENGDTSAGFFAALAVMWALRVYRTGSLGAIAAGTFLAVCSFAAKYHGGLSGLAVALAFALRQPGWRACFARAAWRGWLTMALVAVVSVFLTTPSMLIHPVRTLEDIHGFLTYASKFHLPPHVAAMSSLGRVAFSLKLNLPVVNAMVSLPVTVAFLASVLLALRGQRRLLVLAVLPVTYVLVALGLRAMSHPVYHTLVTPVVFAAAAVVLTRPRAQPLRPSWRAVLLLPGLVAAGVLLNSSLGEAFFFGHRDTRRAAKEWVRENVPHDFAATGGAYTFSLADSGAAGEAGDGALFAVSSLRKVSPPRGFFPVKQVRLEDESIPLFRNPIIDLHLSNGPAIRADFRRPVFLPIPSQTGSRLVFEPLSGFLRDGKVFDVDARQPVDRVFVCPHALEEALVVVRGAGAPVCVEVAFAGVRQAVRLGPGEAQALRFPRPAPGWPHEEGRILYHSSARAGPRGARLAWAFTDAEKGVALWQAGLSDEALPYLIKASAAETNHPTLAVLARLAAAGAAQPISPEALARLDQRAQSFADPWTPERVYAAYGMAPSYLERLPYISWSAEQLRSVGASVAKVDAMTDPENVEPVAIAPTAAASSWWMRSPSFSLASGSYRLEILYNSRAVAGTNTLEIHDFDGRLALVESLPPTSGRRTMRLQVELPDGLVFGAVVVRGDGRGLSVERITLHPDVQRTMDHLGAAWRVATRRPSAGDERDPFTYEAWCAQARQEAAAGRLPAAVDAWSKAHGVRPERSEAVRELAALAPKLAPPAPPVVAEAAQQWAGQAAARELHPVDVRFAPYQDLVGFRLRQAEVQRGGQLGLNLYWSPARTGPLDVGLVAWVHIVNEAGHTVFQSDRDLTADWLHPLEPREVEPDFYLTPVPADTPPGRYRIVMGLYDFESGNRIKPAPGRLVPLQHGVVLPVSLTVR